jgi:hypothetical protein
MWDRKYTLPAKTIRQHFQADCPIIVACQQMSSVVCQNIWEPLIMGEFLDIFCFSLVGFLRWTVIFLSCVFKEIITS